MILFCWTNIHTHIADYIVENNDEIVQFLDLDALPNRRRRGQRGTAKGHAAEKTKKKLGVDKLPLVWNPQFPSIRNDVGAHHSKFSSALGKAVRSHISPYFQYWEDIDEDKKDIIWEEMRVRSYLINNFNL